jgi:hypothetical protein
MAITVPGRATGCIRSPAFNRMPARTSVPNGGCCIWGGALTQHVIFITIMSAKDQ